MSDRVIEVLASSGVDFEVIPIDPALADTAQFCEAYGYALEDSANTILVAGKADPPVHAACIVLAHTKLDVNKAVRKRLMVRKASFAPSQDTERLTGMSIGGVTPFGLPADLPLWVDSRVMDRRRVILGGGSRDRKVLVAPEVLVRIGAVVVDGLAIDASA